MTFNKTFYIKIDGKIYYRRCIYKDMDCRIKYKTASGKIFIWTVDEKEDWYMVPLSELETVDCTDKFKNIAA